MTLQASNGTAEAGLWDANGCDCARISVRDTGWSGIETVGNATGGRQWTNVERATMVGREEAKLLREQLPPAAARLSRAATSFYLTWRALAYSARGDREVAAAMRAARAAYAAE